MAVQAASPFVWGAGGARMTPEEIAAERKVAQALMQQGMDYSPIQSPWQGAARVAQAMMGGLDSARADAAARANAKAEADLLSDPAIFGLPAQSTAAPAVSTPMGATSIPAGKDEFVNSVMPLAQEASAKTGLDPRLIVAQAALESGWGKSAPGNNLFGIKSHGQPGGNVLPTTEVVNGQPVQTTDSFRAYGSPAESVQGYADFITSNPRYKPMMAAQGLEAQAAALGQSGYATDPNYGQKVLQIARSLPTPAAASAATVIGPNDPSPLDTAQWPAGPVGGPSDVAALPEAAQPAQGALPTAPAPASPFAGVNPRLLSAMSSPYISDGTKKVLGLVLTQQLSAAQKANDPLRGLQMEKLRADIDKTRGKAGTTEFGLNPIYGTDDQGNPVLGTLGKDGSFKRIDTGGVKVSTGVDKIDLGTQFAIYDKKSGQLIGYQPKDLAGAEAEKAKGKAQGEARAALPTDLQTAEQTVKEIDSLLKNEGLNSVVGPIDQFRPSWTMDARGRDALARYNQLKGRSFLQAYSMLKGGGQITEIEGTKAENAMARMDRAQSEEDFKLALTDFRDAVSAGMQKLREKAGVPASTPGATSSGDWQDVGGVKIRRKQ